MATTEATATLAGTPIDIPLAWLRPAPWNARKTFNEDALNELADSIRRNGIIQPLTVRVAPEYAWETLTDLEAKQLAHATLYEIVAGDRRSRGAGLAELVTVPCIVRDLSDDQAREIGLTENLQREDLQPLDEAAAYGELIAAPDATVEKIAAKTGKAPWHIARRLRLLSCVQEVRDALKAGAIEVGHALELARLDEKQQIAFLRQLNVIERVPNSSVSLAGDEDEDLYDPGDDFDEDDEEAEAMDSEDRAREKQNEPETRWRATGMSVAELKRRIASQALIVLSAAPFPLEDEIDPMACTECPKRSSNAQLLFQDVAQDTCTDRECFNGKLRAWVRFSLDEAEKSGKMLVLIGSEMYYNPKPLGIVERFNYALVKEGEACESSREAIFYDGARMGHRALICTEQGCAKHHPNMGGGGKQQTREQLEHEKAKQKENSKKVLASVRVHKRYRGALIDAIGKAPVPETVLSAFATETCEKLIRGLYSPYQKRYAQALGWDPEILGYDKRNALQKKLNEMPVVERLRAAMIAMHYNDLAVSEQMVTRKDYRPESFERIAGALGVDYAALRTAAEVDPKAAKEKPEQPETPKAEPKKAATAKSLVAPEAKPEAKTAAKKAAKPTAKKPAKKR